MVVIKWLLSGSIGNGNYEMTMIFITFFITIFRYSVFLIRTIVSGLTKGWDKLRTFLLRGEIVVVGGKRVISQSL